MVRSQRAGPIDRLEGGTGKLRGCRWHHCKTPGGLEIVGVKADWLFDAPRDASACLFGMFLVCVFALGMRLMKGRLYLPHSG